MGEFFPNQYCGNGYMETSELPIIESHDFNFFRCLEFNDGYYGKTVSELHSGNLRLSAEKIIAQISFPVKTTLGR